MEKLFALNTDVKSMEISAIKKNICGKSPSLIIERELVRRITLTEPSPIRNKAENFFLGDFSVPILDYVSLKIYKSTYYQKILGEYYEFISKENKHIPYYKLTLYNNINNSTLRNYITVITLRYFTSKKEKSDKIDSLNISIEGQSTLTKDKDGNEMIENPWFLLLISSQGDTNDSSLSPEAYQKIDYVFSKLPERDVKVIKLMVMDELSGLEAFEELKEDLARTAKIPVSTWSTKQKQDAMSLQRSRALKHFKKIVEDEKIDF